MMHHELGYAAAKHHTQYGEGKVVAYDVILPAMLEVNRIRPARLFFIPNVWFWHQGEGPLYSMQIILVKASV